MKQNHELWHVCPNCGFEYDMRLHGYDCPNCHNCTTVGDMIKRKKQASGHKLLAAEK